MGQQQGKEKERERGPGTGPGATVMTPGPSSVSSVGGVISATGGSIRAKAGKPKAATVSAASSGSGKERGILGSNIFTEHSGKIPCAAKNKE